MQRLSRRSKFGRSLTLFLSSLVLAVLVGLVPAFASSEGETVAPGASLTDAQGMGAPATDAQIEALRELSPQVAANADGSASPNLAGSPVGSAATPEQVEQWQRDWESAHSRSSATAREDSRTAFADLDRADAADLFAQEFPFLVEVPSSSEEILGGELKRFIADDAAIVETDSGDRVVAVSQEPLATESGGDLEAVDLTLRNQGQSFVPENANAETALPKDIETGLPLATSDAEMTFPDASDAGAGIRIGDSTAAFYPEVAPDTDLVVRPTATGFQFALQIRSEQSPERFSLPVDLPSGSNLVEVSDGGGAVVENAAGEEAVSISAVTALDADGYPVEASLTVDGDDLVVHAAHQVPTTTYPVVADPVISDLMQFDSGAEGWSCANFSSAPYTGSLFGSGLIIIANPGTYTSNQRYICAYFIPHINDATTAYVSQARFSWSFNRGVGDNANKVWPYLDMGIFSSASGGYYVHRNPVTATNAGNTLLPYPNPSTDQSAKQVMFEMNGGSTGGATITSAGGRFSYLSDATVNIADNDAPGTGVYSSDVPASGWVGGGQSYSVTFLGADPGLGVKTMHTSIDGGTAAVTTQKIPGTSTNCDGYRETNKCPNWGATIRTFLTNDLTSGVHQLYGWSIDVAGNGSNPFTNPVPVRVDRTDPELPALSGSLSPGSSQPGSSLTVNATDLHSGVKSIELSIDGQPAAPGDVQGGSAAACPDASAGGCTRSLTFKANPSNPSYASGTHAFSVKVTDQTGNTKTRDWNATIETTAPQLSLSGPMTSGTSVVGGVSTMTYSASDADSGVAEVELLVDDTVLDFDDQTCAQGGCGLSGDLSAVLKAFSPGSHDYSVKAIDAAGNQTVSTGTFTLDPTPPQISATGTLASASDAGHLDQPTASLSVTASDGTSAYTGVSRISVLVDDTPDGEHVLTCSSGCPTSGTLNYTYEKSDWPAGSHVVVVVAVDGAGNESRLLYQVDPEMPAPVSCSSVTPEVQLQGNTRSKTDAVTDIESNTASAPVLEQTSAGYSGSLVTDLDPSLQPLASGGYVSSGSIDTTVVPADLSDGVRVGSDLCIQPMQTTAAQATAVISGDSAVYANSATSTDTVVRPLGTGAMLAQIVQGSDRPSFYEWKVSLPPGAELQQLSNGSVAIVQPSQTWTPAAGDGGSLYVPPDPGTGSDPSILADPVAQTKQAFFNTSQAAEVTQKAILALISRPYALMPNGTTQQTSISVVGTSQIKTATIPNSRGVVTTIDKIEGPCVVRSPIVVYPAHGSPLEKLAVSKLCNVRNDFGMFGKWNINQRPDYPFVTGTVPGNFLLRYARQVGSSYPVRPILDRYVHAPSITGPASVATTESTRWGGTNKFCTYLDQTNPAPQGLALGRPCVTWRWPP